MRIDLFNHGYYWEAHEAWEPLWHTAKQSTQHRLFFKGLILLAAAARVKIREGESGSLPRAVLRELQRFFVSRSGHNFPGCFYFILAPRFESV